MVLRPILFVMLLSGLTACDTPTTRLPAPEVDYGSVYISCEKPPHLLSIDSLFTTCTSEESLEALESSRQIIGCTMEDGRVPADKADFLLDKVPEGYRVQSLRPEVSILLASGEPVEEMTVDYNNSFLVARGELILRFYLRNQFVGGCPHDELFWQEYFP